MYQSRKAAQTSEGKVRNEKLVQSKNQAKNLSKGAAAMEDYMMASKSVGVIPLALSLVTSFMSAITVLGVPAEILKCGKVLKFVTF